MFSVDIKEEELKLVVAKTFFGQYDTTRIIGNIDFCVAPPTRPNQDTLFNTEESLVWAEAKKGTTHNIYHSFVQLILTIGRARTFDDHLPPKYLGAFDAEKIAFIEFNEVQEVFHLNDFNWNVSASDHSTKEFGLLQNLVAECLQQNILLFRYATQQEEIRAFIRHNLKVNTESTLRIQVNKNNFIHIYQRWREQVMPQIDIDWEKARKSGIIGADFYLADLLSEGNNTLIDTLYVLLKDDTYELDRTIDDSGFFNSKKATFKAGGLTKHTQFWNHYERPPRREYWDYLIKRRDLLVPQDIRERKGSFFTPRQWVQLSQEYLAKVLGENWQEEYYIWDCCAGTGNLLEGLTNKYNIYASTLDKQDVNIMHERIEKMNQQATRPHQATTEGGANLLKEHVFQFDFLNDDLQDPKKVPASLRSILADPQKRKKLVIYINPPYAEATNARTITGTGENRKGLAKENNTYDKYKGEMGDSSNELFAQFFMRIYKEIGGCILGDFSTIKILQGPSFNDFRALFRAKLERLFIVPSNTFDNVPGKFPIGFFIWDTSKNETFKNIDANVYDNKGKLIGIKNFHIPYRESLNEWIVTFPDVRTSESNIGYMSSYPPDVQNTGRFSILSAPQKRYCYNITKRNLIPFVVYFSVRYSIKATWINNSDLFFSPINGWQEDKEFQSDCLAYTLFHEKNRITSVESTNHWIPFTEKEAEPRGRFESHFMTHFMQGKLTPTTPAAPVPKMLGEELEQPSATTTFYNGTEPISFSPEAQLLFDAGRRLWQYYHSQTDSNPNASYYDIKGYFQGFNAKGRMNNTSTDPTYNQLRHNLCQALAYLATHKIVSKAYAYGFMRKEGVMRGT